MLCNTGFQRDSSWILGELGEYQATLKISVSYRVPHIKEGLPVGCSTARMGLGDYFWEMQQFYSLGVSSRKGCLVRIWSSHWPECLIHQSTSSHHLLHNGSLLYSCFCSWNRKKKSHSRWWGPKSADCSHEEFTISHQSRGGQTS